MSEGYEERAVQRGEAMAEEVSQFVNSYGNSRERKAFAAKLARDHRTLQQSSMRLFMGFVEELAKNGTDLRNEAAVTLAKAIMALPEAQRALPLI